MHATFLCARLLWAFFSCVKKSGHEKASRIYLSPLHSAPNCNLLQVLHEWAISGLRSLVLLPSAFPRQLNLSSPEHPWVHFCMPAGKDAWKRLASGKARVGLEEHSTAPVNVASSVERNPGCLDSPEQLEMFLSTLNPPTLVLATNHKKQGCPKGIETPSDWPVKSTYLRKPVSFLSSPVLAVALQHDLPLSIFHCILRYSSGFM